MLGKAEKKAAAERRALEINDRLMDLKPTDLSEAQWCKRAGVSGSFFTNMRGKKGSPPSEPSLKNLIAVLDVINVTLPEFFLREGQGRVIPNPPEEDTVAAYRDLIQRLPKGADAGARFLNRNVRKLLGLPPGPRLADPELGLEGDAPEEAAPVRSATKKAGS